MRRWRFLAVALVVSLAAGGCVEQKKYDYRIAVIPKGLTHEFWQSIHRGAERAAADLEKEGIRTRIVWDGPLREQDALAQIRIVDRRISTRVDGIVLAPQHSKTMVAPVERAVAEGIPVVIIDSGLDLKDHPDLIVKYVATDNYRGGWLAAEHLLQLLEDDLAKDGQETANIILFRYQIGSESTDRREQGFEDYVTLYGEGKAPGQNQTKRIKKINWLSKDKYAGATKDSALKEAAPLLNSTRDKKIHGIFAPNESSANGMLDAMRSLDLKGVRLMGFDSSEPLLVAVRQGDLDGLILQDPYKMGYLGTWTLVNHLRGVDVFAGQKEVSTGEHVITRDNVDLPTTIQLFDAERQAQRSSEELRQGHAYGSAPTESGMVKAITSRRLEGEGRTAGIKPAAR